MTKEAVKKWKSTFSQPLLLLVGAEGRTRTGTSFGTLDFESSASANSATSAVVIYITILLFYHRPYILSRRIIPPGS